MNQEEDFASDSEQSDEDFCPDKEAGASDVVSEESSDDAVDSVDDDATEVNKQSKSKELKQVARKTKRLKKKVKESVAAQPDDPETEQSIRRSTRQTDESNANGKGIEKNELESDEEDKSRTDALWADFLSDVKPVRASTSSSSSNSKVVKANTAVKSKLSNGSSREKDTEKSAEFRTDDNKVPKQITVTEIVDFAGEEVRVEKLVNADSIKETKGGGKQIVGMPSSSSRTLSTGLKRTGASSGGGLGSILNQIGKKKKISVLEKTQLDWKSFKQDEGIEEQLLTHNKGKDGFLERQDFLQRTDVRQFEIEKSLRQSKRSN